MPAVVPSDMRAHQNWLINQESIPIAERPPAAEESDDSDFEEIEVERKLEEKWDCQSILSAYSNTQNHPKLIVEKAKVQIKISNKTGLPLGVLPTKTPKKSTITYVVALSEGDGLRYMVDIFPLPI